MNQRANDYFNEAMQMIGYGARHMKDSGDSVEEIQEAIRDMISAMTQFISTIET